MMRRCFLSSAPKRKLRGSSLGVAVAPRCAVLFRVTPDGRECRGQELRHISIHAQSAANLQDTEN
jgi:hypothetical protein